MAKADAMRGCEEKCEQLRLLAELYETELTIKTYLQIPEQERKTIQTAIDTGKQKAHDEISKGAYGKNLWILFNDTDTDKQRKNKNKTEQMIQKEKAGEELERLFAKGRCAK